jgi:dipeptidyl aminopeptidase/acylaminoacyl peptidase
VFVQSSATGAGGGGGASAAALKSFVGMPAATAKSAISTLGLTAVTVPVLSAAVAVGTVAAQAPGVGAILGAGGSVFLYVSADPRIAYDSGSQTDQSAISIASGPTATPLIAAPTAAGSTNIEPSWSPDGKLIAYVNRVTSGTTVVGTVHIVDIAKSTDTPLQDGGVDMHRPVFAPLSGHHLLVFTSPAPSGGWQPCFVDLDKPLPAAKWCAQADTSDALDRPTWSPDGRAVLFQAVNLSTNTPDGLREYTAPKPFAVNGAKWKEAAPILSGWSIYFVAWSPDGSTIALSSTGPPGSTTTTDGLYTTTPSAMLQGTVNPVGTPATPAAELAWRSDGKLVVSSLGCETGPATSPLVLIDPLNPAVAQPPLTVTGCDPAVEPLPPPPPPG